MSTTTIAGRDVTVDAEGFLTEFGKWDEELAAELASQIGIEMTDGHWKAVRFARQDFLAQGETPTLRRMQVEGGVTPKEMFVLVPQKPAKKMAYIAGLPKPAGCV